MVSTSDLMHCQAACTGTARSRAMDASRGGESSDCDMCFRVVRTVENRIHLCESDPCKKVCTRGKHTGTEAKQTRRQSSKSATSTYDLADAGVKRHTLHI